VTGWIRESDRLTIINYKFNIQNNNNKEIFSINIINNERFNIKTNKNKQTKNVSIKLAIKN